MVASLPLPRIVLEVFDDDSSTHGPSTLRGIIDDAAKVGWSWYSRFPASCFWTIDQKSRANTIITPGLSHVKAWYVDDALDYSVQVFQGRIGDPDQSADDVVWTAWSYLAELALSLTGYKVDYISKIIGSEIVTPEWSRNTGASGTKFFKYGARVRANSLLNHVATGTIQDPLNTAGTGAMRTDSKFGVIDVPRLLLFFDLSEIGRANTLNNVTFEITRANPTFNFWKNKGTKLAGRVLKFPHDVLDYRYVPGVLDVRNFMATIGTKGGVSTELTEEVTTGPYGSVLFGKREDVFTIKTLSGYPNITVADSIEDAQRKITKRAAQEASQLTRLLQVEVAAQTFLPFNGWDVEDTIRLQINNGMTVLDADYRIVGVRGVLDQSGYNSTLFLNLPVA